VSVAVVELCFGLTVVIAEKFQENALDYGDALGGVFSDLFFPVFVVN